MFRFFAIIVVFASRIGIDCAEFRALNIGHPFEDKEPKNVQNAVREDFGITAPGTKWCGPGNTSNQYDDLGYYVNTDKCCRDHDHCEGIPAGQEMHGLKNEDIIKILHCDCDKQFYQCLHDDYSENSKTYSDFIGSIYFGIRPKCYKEAYPIVKCVEHVYNLLALDERCIKYEFDTSQPMKYQWFDNPFYDTTPYPSRKRKYNYV